MWRHVTSTSFTADVGFMAVGDEGGFKKVVDPTARVFEYTSLLD